MIKKILIYTLITVTTFSASLTNNELKAELERVQHLLELEKIDKKILEKELNICKLEKEALLETPQQKLIKANKLSYEKKYDKALRVYEEIIKTYPGTKECTEAQKKYKNIKVKLEKIAREKAHQKALGFRGIKPKIKFNINDVKLNFQKISIKRRWTFDSYGREWYYKDAQKDSNFIVATVKISSKKKNPSLPVISAYELKNGELHFIGNMLYRFRRWSSYGTYLGNEADFKNDFAYTSTIPFTLGVEVSKHILKTKPIFIVASKKLSIPRQYEEFGKPPVNYYYHISMLPKETLSVDDLAEDFILIKVFNKKKI